MKAALNSTTITRIFMVITLSLIFSTPVFATSYKVVVSKVGDNMYKDANSSTLIKTIMCLEHAYGDDAVLIWNYPIGTEFSYGGKLIFSDGDTCDVMAVY